MAVGDGRDDQLVGTSCLLELLELVGDLLRGAGELCLCGLAMVSSSR